MAFRRPPFWGDPIEIMRGAIVLTALNIVFLLAFVFLRWLFRVLW